MWFQIQFLLATVEGFIKSVTEYTVESIEAVWDAAPNPLAMWDAVMNFFTGLPGLVVSAPFNGMKEFVLDQLRKGKMLKRVMTLEQAINLAFDAASEFARNVTFMDSSGIVGWLAGWIGRFLWTLTKRIKLLRSLFRAKSEAEAIQVVLDSLKRRVGLLRIVAMVIGAILIIHTIGFMFWTIGLALLFLEGSVEKRLLFNKHPKQSIDKPSRQYRQK